MARNKDHGHQPRQGGQSEERKDWRRKSSGDRNARGGTGEGWQGDNRPAVRYPRYRRLMRLISATTVLAVLLGMWFLYVIRSHRQVPLYTIVVTDYQSTYSEKILPPNSFAYEDLQLFDSIFQRRTDQGITRNVGLVALNSPAGEGRYSRDWLREGLPRILEEGVDVAEPGGPGNDVVMFYISAHGAVNAEGKACLLMSDSDPLDCGTWEPVRDVLASVEGVKRLEGCKKIIFLDTSRMCENWRMGVLCNTFAERLDEAVNSLGSPNLVVINSADTSQTVWTAPEESCTAFGRTVAGALAGEAERSGWLSRTLGLSNITLRELASYVVDGVRQWSQLERGAYQTPTVHFAGEDELPAWTLADSAGKSVDDIDRESRIHDLESTVKRRADEIAEFWEQMDMLARHNIYLAAPLEWASLQTRLARLESLMLAGHKYNTEYANLKSRIADRLQKLRGTFSSGAGVARLAGPENSHGDNDNTASYFAASLPLARQIHGPAAERNTLAQKRTAWSANPDPDAQQWQELTYLDAVDIGVDWLEQLPSPIRQDMDRVVSLAERCLKDRECHTVEVEFLKMLSHDTLPNGQLSEQINEAMRCRFLAERAAAPPDQRALYWIEDAVKPTDIARRAAEDQLLIGDKTAEQLQAWQTLNRDYAAAETTGREVAEALRVRDRAWADISGLAKWKLRDLRKRGEQPDEVFQSLLDVIRLTHQLDSLLVEREGDWSASIRDQTQTVRAKLAELWAEYGGSVSAIINSDTNDADSLHRMAVILSAPLSSSAGESLAANPTESRGAVLKRYVKCLFASDRQSGKAKLDDAATTTYMREAKHWECHPLTAILEESKGSAQSRRLDSLIGGDTSAVPHWERQGTQIREFLHDKLVGVLDVAVTESVTKLRAQEEDPTREAHQRLRDPERLFRAAAPTAAPVLNTPPHDKRNPVRLTRQIAWLRQFLWQHHRTLDDCYLTIQKSGDSTTTFVNLASNGYEGTTEKIGDNIGRGLPQSLRFYQRIERIADIDLQQLAAARARAQGLLFRNESVSIKLRRGDDDVHEASGRNVSHKIDLDAAPELPSPGLGFLELRRLNGEPFPARFSAVTPSVRHRVPPQADPQHLPLTIPRTELIGISKLYAKSYFRGGWNQQELKFFEPNKGSVVIYPQPDYQTPRITVEGDRSKPALIVFVLDCSGSMNDPIAREAAGGDNKIETARTALRGILDNLHRYQKDNRGQYHVGLVLFGHRSTWKEDVKRATDNVEDFDVRDDYPQDIHPNNDIETIPDRLRPLTEETLKLFHTRIADLQPRGVTPLYAALAEAVSTVAAVQNIDASSKHIIAITDGVNETPSTPSGQFQVTSADVRQLAEEYDDIQIDIVGFDVQYTSSIRRRMERSTFDAKVEELRQISKTFSEGEYYPADEPGELTRKLQDAVKPAEVVVRHKPRGDKDYQVEQNFPLGKTWVHDAWNGRADQCQLSVRNPQSGLEAETDVELEGGEHLRLVYDGSSLLHQPHQSRELQEEDPHPNVAGNFYVAALVPQWEGDQLVFRALIRNKDATQFSARPTGVWAEITPVGGKQDHAFTFYDLEFENNTRVPILRFRTLDWPSGLERAQMQLWLQFGKSRPDPDFDEPITNLTPKQRFSTGIDGVEFEIEPERISTETEARTYEVWEYYDAPTSHDMPLTQVQMWPTPHYTEHEYRHEDKIVRHLFRYTTGSNLTAVRLRITARQKVHGAAGVAAITDDPISVTLPPRY